MGEESYPKLSDNQVFTVSRRVKVLNSDCVTSVLSSSLSFAGRGKGEGGGGFGEAGCQSNRADLDQ